MDCAPWRKDVIIIIIIFFGISEVRTNRPKNFVTHIEQSDEYFP